MTFGLGGRDVDISRHAKKRWRKRVTRAPAHAIELRPQLWYNATPVLAPEVDGDEVRLYPIDGQRDMLLVGKHSRGKVVVTTVLYADYSRLPNARQEDF